MLKIYNIIANYLEESDIIPWILLVSLPHYTKVLAEFEYQVVAVAMGFLADLGHYRVVKRYNKKKDMIGWVLALTVMSYGFHVAFYILGDAAETFGGETWWAWVLGAVPPVLIFAMASLSHKENWSGKTRAKKPSGSSGKSSAKLPVNSGTKKRYSELTAQEKQWCRSASPKRIAEKFGCSPRVARNWRNK
jgi:hypothetical protein